MSQINKCLNFSASSLDWYRNYMFMDLLLSFIQTVLVVLETLTCSWWFLIFIEPAVLFFKGCHVILRIQLIRASKACTYSPACTIHMRDDDLTHSKCHTHPHPALLIHTSKLLVLHRSQHKIRPIVNRSTTLCYDLVSWARLSRVWKGNLV